MTTTNNIKGWIGVLMTEDFSFHGRTKPRHLSSETSRPAGLEFVFLDTTGFPMVET